MGSEKHSGGFGCSSCLLWFVLLFGLIGGYAVYLVAATGLVDVPKISAWAFHEPKPDHEVAPSTSFDTWFSNYLVGSVSTNAASRTSVTIPEDVLTGLIRQGAGVSMSPSVDLSKSQIAAVGEDLEIFLPFKETAMVWRVRPKLEEGLLVLETEALRVGGSPVPRVFARTFLDRAARLALSNVQDEVAAYANLSGVRVTPEGLVLEGELELKTGL